MKLKKDHKHAGREHRAGETITVAAHHLRSLVGQGVIDPRKGEES